MITPLRWIALAFLVLPVMGDTLVLKDGTRLEGDVKRTPDGYDLTDASGKIRHVASSEVASIVLGKSDVAGSSGKDRLASLKRSVEQLTDLDQIIDRFNRFIDQTTDEAVKAEARKELDQWRERKQKGLVKVAGKWVTPAERDAIIASAAVTAEQARDALQQNRNKDAELLIKQTLEVDSGNTVALYLQGVLLYRQNKLPLARRSFESVVETLPEHAATLNNIAVILVQQKELMRSMPYFDRAMLGMPDNKYILGNVLETFMMLSDNQQKNAAIAKVRRRFDEQDARLSQKMAQYGWYRWGSIWVDQAKIDQLKKEEAEVRARMDALQKEFDAAEARQVQITGQIDANERFMFDIRQRSTYRDASGNLIRIPYPQSYYDADAENQRLVVERTTIQQEQNIRRQKAQQMKGELPSAKFSGVLHLIEVEGAPDGPMAPAPVKPEHGPSTKASTTQGEGPF